MMYGNFTKTQALPLAFRFSSQPAGIITYQNFENRSLLGIVHPNISVTGISFRNVSHVFHQKTRENVLVVKSKNFPSGFHQKNLVSSNKSEPINFLNGFHLKGVLQGVPVVRTRNFSSRYSQKPSESDGGVRAGEALPWIASYRNKESKRVEKTPTERASRSSWLESANRFSLKREADSAAETKETRSRTIDIEDTPISISLERDEDGQVEEEESEIVDDPRWDKIKRKYKRISDVQGSERPEFRRWNKQEIWGRKTWKEATASTLPKMVGEGIYGVGPVLAALSAGRRQLYTLYVQEGLDLSSNNRKKKDKKGFEKILKIAGKIGLTRKEASKHDLNMIVDNRPHQGLVLDASSLEMVSMRELDPLMVEGEKGPLWIALDEVTDPQNLGAIIRSAYFFGSAGVVLCAKNSAPLSGVVSKASAGSLELMELRSCKNMMQFLGYSAQNRWRVLGGSVSSKAVPLNEVIPGAPTILVLGSEGTGLRPLVERSCTQLIRIPGNIPMDILAGGVDNEEAEEVDQGCSGREFRSFMAVESLNVSVAAGVLLHHLVGNNSNGFVDYKQTNSLE